MNAKDKFGETALHSAAGRGHLEIVKLLIAKGADVNARRENGETVLHSASVEGHLEIVKLLTDNGAEVNQRTL